MKLVKLNDIAEIAAGFPLRGAVGALGEGGVHLVQMRNVKPDQDIDWPTVSRVALPTRREPNWLADGDILFTARGSKNFALAVQSPPKKAVCSPHFFVLKISGASQILPEFLAWQINQKPAQNYFQYSATGSNILNIRRYALENLEIAIPPLNKQNLIVELWRTALEEQRTIKSLIENRNQQLEAIATSLIQTAGEKTHG